MDARGSSRQKRAYRTWTAEEDLIVRTNSVRTAASKLLRTLSMVKNRRAAIGHARPLQRWSKWEDNRLRKYAAEPIAKLGKRFKNRTVGAVRSRRDFLALTPRPRTKWRASDVKKLQRYWPTATTAELEAMFPGRSYGAISKFADVHSLPRRFATKKSTTNDLRDQIRNRLKEDGICIKRFSTEIGCGIYFCGAPQRRIHLDKIAKAVDYFGGRLVIDWQDE